MASSSRKPYSATSFANSKNLKPFYTGGPTAISNDGQFLFTAMGQHLMVTHVKSGVLVDRIRGDTEDLTAICLTPDSSTLILSSRSLSLRIFSISFSSPNFSSSASNPIPTLTHSLIRTIPSLHSSSLTLIVSDPNSNFIATGSTDGTTKIWDLKKGFCTHFFKSTSSGVISSICWNVEESRNNNKGKRTGMELDVEIEGEEKEKKMELIVGSVDGSIRIWDLFKSSISSSKGKSKEKEKEIKPIQILSNGHVSPVRGLALSSNGKNLLSASRDKTVVRWKVSSSHQKIKWNLMETITVGESIESLGFIQNPVETSSDSNQNKKQKKRKSQSNSDLEDLDFFWSAGEKGEMKIWSLSISENESSTTSSSSLISEENQNLKLRFIQPDSISTVKENDFEGSSSSAEETRAINEVHQFTSNEKTSLVSIHSDQTIIFRNGPYSSSSSNKNETSSFKPLEMIRQLIGFNDEIVDLCLLAPNGYSTPTTTTISENQSVAPMSTETHLAIATNSNYPRIYSLKNDENHVELLNGSSSSNSSDKNNRHSDMILCLDSSCDSKWLASGSKDRTARIWVSKKIYKINSSSTSEEKEEDESGSSSKDRIEWYSNGIAEGHSESIGAIAMARRGLNPSSSPSSTSSSNDSDSLIGYQSPFMITGSSDKTIKLWDLTPLSTPSNPENQTTTKLKSLLTLKIHEKDINTLDVSPNNALLISGSQDKTAKVFSLTFSKPKNSSSSIASIKHLATCSGHKRGIWSIKFSPIDAAFATSSGDKTIRLWSLKDFSCVKTFDSNSNSILRLDFLNRGTQILSSGAEGLIRLWNVKDEENVWNKDVSKDRIWGLKVFRGGKEFVWAGSEGVIGIWKDDTKEKIEVEGKRREGEVQLEQDFNNYLSIQDYKNAINLALKMNQPRRLFFLFNQVSNSRPDLDSIKGLDSDSKGKGKRKEGKDDDDEEPLGASQLLNQVLNLNLPNSKSKSKSKSNLNLRNLPEDDKSKLEDYNSITGLKSVDSIIKNLSSSNLNQLLVYVRDWNTSFKTSSIAQMILHCILRFKKANEIRDAFKDEDQNQIGLNLEDEMDLDSDDSDDDDGDDEISKVKSKEKGKKQSQLAKASKNHGEIKRMKDLGGLLDGIIPYTQRHLSRSDRNLMESSVLDYTLKCMDQILGEGDLEEDGEEDSSEDESEEDEVGEKKGLNGKSNLNGNKMDEESEEDESEAESEDVLMQD